MLSQCYAQMKISFPGLIFAQYKSINIILLNIKSDFRIYTHSRATLPWRMIEEFVKAITTKLRKMFFLKVIPLLTQAERKLYQTSRPLN